MAQAQSDTEAACRKPSGSCSPVFSRRNEVPNKEGRVVQADRPAQGEPRRWRGCPRLYSPRPRPETSPKKSRSFFAGAPPPHTPAGDGPLRSHIPLLRKTRDLGDGFPPPRPTDRFLRSQLRRSGPGRCRARPRCAPLGLTEPRPLSGAILVLNLLPILLRPACFLSNDGVHLIPSFPTALGNRSAIPTFHSLDDYSLSKTNLRKDPSQVMRPPLPSGSFFDEKMLAANPARVVDRGSWARAWRR